MAEEPFKTWRPTAAGIMSILLGTFTVYYHTFGTFTNHWHTLNLIIPDIIGLVAIVGGIYGIKRQKWRLSLAGAICTIYPPHPWGSLVWTPILGILAIWFLVSSKKEFTN